MKTILTSAIILTLTAGSFSAFSNTQSGKLNLKTAVSDTLYIPKDNPYSDIPMMNKYNTSKVVTVERLNKDRKVEESNNNIHHFGSGIGSLPGEKKYARRPSEF